MDKADAIIEAVQAGRGTPTRDAFISKFLGSLHGNGFTVVPTGDLPNGYPPSTADPYSKKAAHDVAPRAGSMRYAILLLLARRWGMTTEEIEDSLGGKHQTVSARVYELERGHFIERTGESRRNRSGSEAAVYDVTEAGRDALT